MEHIWTIKGNEDCYPCNFVRQRGIEYFGKQEEFTRVDLKFRFH